MSIQWIIFNSVTIFILAYLQYFHDAFNQLMILDHTFTSFIILGIYAIISAYLGIVGNKANLEAVRFTANNLPLIGMIGTLAAVMTVIHQAQTSGAASLSQFDGLYSIFITTLFGIMFMGLTKFQIAFIYQDYDKD